MGTELVPFVNAQESGLEELAGASPSAMNVVCDTRGTVRRRPGIAAYSGAPAGVIDAAGIAGLYATLDGTLFAVTAPNPALDTYHVTAGAATSIGAVDGTGRPVFAETEILLLIAAGSFPQKVELTGTYNMSVLAGPPPECSHILAQNLRLLANDTVVDKTKVRYSSISQGTLDYSGHEIWDPALGNPRAGFFTAEARPDPVVALGENTNEVFIFGSGTTQVHAPDAALVYAPVSAIEVGCSAPYGTVKVDADFLWLDHRKRFVRSNGRGFDPIGGASIQKTIDAIGTVSDVYGYHVAMGAVAATAWSFPSDGRTFVFQEGIGWGQWAGWDGGNWTPFPVLSHHLRSGTGENLVGLTTGEIGVLSFDASTDLGTRINAYCETGFLDRGTSAQKQCVEVRVTIKRGHATTGEPFGLLYWRDSLGEWESPLEVSLGASGDYETTVRFRSLGVYRTRQWRFQFDGDPELILVKVEEDFEVL